MMRALLHWLTGRLRVNIVKAEVSAQDPTRTPLFERYLVCGLPGGGAVYLHHYLRPDPDRGLHDHPWPWAIALPLAGGYYEERVWRWGLHGPHTCFHRRRPGLPYLLSGHDFHQISEMIAGTSWSLFIHGANSKAWGFMRPLEDEPGTCRYSTQSTGDGGWNPANPRGRDVERAAA